MNMNIFNDIYWNNKQTSKTTQPYLQHIKDYTVWSADRILKRLKGQADLLLKKEEDKIRPFPK